MVTGAGSEQQQTTAMLMFFTHDHIAYTVASRLVETPERFVAFFFIKYVKLDLQMYNLFLQMTLNLILLLDCTIYQKIKHTFRLHIFHTVDDV